MTRSHFIFFTVALLLASCRGGQPFKDTQTRTTTTLLLDGETVGCGFFAVYIDTQDKTKAVKVSGETKDLKGTFALIAEELRHQYRLGFYPADLKRDGTVHTLQVKVNLPDVSVRSRREYLAK